MTWLFYALLCALAESLKDITSKQGLRSLDPFSVTCSFFLVTSVICTPLLWWEPLPSLGPHFWWCLVSHATLFGISAYLYMKALSLSELSLCVPLVMTTPIFMLATAPIGLGEWPSRLGLLGTVFIVVGAYLLNIRSIRRGPLEPFRALLVERGARLMLLVAFIWSITSVIDKLGIQNSSPTLWAVSIYWVISAVMVTLLIARGTANFGAMRQQWLILGAVGFCNAVQLLSYVLALERGLAVYVLSIKRCSVLLVLVLGALFFGESRIKERLFAVAIMLLGVFCIGLGS